MQPKKRVEPVKFGVSGRHVAQQKGRDALHRAGDRLAPQLVEVLLLGPHQTDHPDHLAVVRHRDRGAGREAAPGTRTCGELCDTLLTGPEEQGPVLDHRAVVRNVGGGRDLPPGAHEVAGDADLSDQPQGAVEPGSIDRQRIHVLADDVEQQLRGLVALARGASQRVHDRRHHPGLDVRLLA